VLVLGGNGKVGQAPIQLATMAAVFGRTAAAMNLLSLARA
jgi:hypothetical protein